MVHLLALAFAQDNTPPRTEEQVFPTVLAPAEAITTTPLPPDACSDPDGDPLVYRIDGPPWAVLTGDQLAVQPLQADHGRHVVDLFATDGSAEAFCGTWIVEVDDRTAPVVALLGPGDVRPGTAFGVIVEPSEPLASLAPIDFEIEGGEVLEVRSHLDGTSLLIQGDGTGTVVLELPAGRVEDHVGNLTTATARLEVPLAPQLELEGPPVSTTTGCASAPMWIGRWAGRR